ncbi:hypothetical protein BDR06DRAFT_1010642 [Suillus hirtellus]|nr:hypothetical protein BDR06DRAFT_1010642 [Suillus hirtellus]
MSMASTLVHLAAAASQGKAHMEAMRSDTERSLREWVQCSESPPPLTWDSGNVSSWDPLTTRPPPELQHTEHTLFVCPINLLMTLPVSTFRNLTMPSTLPVATVLPSSDNAMVCTPFCAQIQGRDNNLPNHLIKHDDLQAYNQSVAPSAGGPLKAFAVTILSIVGQRRNLPVEIFETLGELSIPNRHISCRGWDSGSPPAIDMHKFFVAP